MAKMEKAEGPAESIKELFPTGGAEKLPTKHYPDSTRIATEGKKTSCDGPGEKLWRP